MLEELGLDRQGEAIYRLMLIHRDWGVHEIASNLRISESQVRETLSRLADLALLRQSLDAPGKMLPVSPEFGLQLLLERQHARLLERERRFAEDRAAVSQVIADYIAVQPYSSGGRVTQLDGLDAIQARLEELATRANSKCLSFMPGGAQSRQSLAASKPLDERMLRGGVEVLTVYLTSVRNDPATLGYAKWLTDLGGEVRTVPTLPLRMVLFDGAVALVPVDLDNSRRGAVELAVTAAIRALASLFEQVWQSAAPLGDEPRFTDSELTMQERELLRLLGQGLTDEVASRQLGISLRSERRMMAHIMQRLNARSRFEAGIRAKERDWL